MLDTITMCTHKDENGATLVELAMALPFVILFALIVIWAGLTINAYTSMQTALSRSLRLSVTRGLDEVVGTQVIDEVNTWDTSRLEGLMTKDVPWSDAISTFNDQVDRIFPGDTLDTLPTSYAYFHIYMTQAMKQGIGANFRYPCDPAPSSAPIDGAGCLACQPLNPTTDANSRDYPSTNAYSDVAPARRLGFKCQLQPNIMLLSPISRILSVVSGGTFQLPTIVLTYQEMYEAT